MSLINTGLSIVRLDGGPLQPLQVTWLIWLLHFFFTQSSISALYIYDWLITLDLEVNHVWRSRWTRTTWIFVAIRYVTWIYVILDSTSAPNKTVSFLYVSNWLSLNRCNCRCEYSKSTCISIIWSKASSTTAVYGEFDSCKPSFYFNCSHRHVSISFTTLSQRLTH